MYDKFLDLYKSDYAFAKRCGVNKHSIYAIRKGKNKLSLRLAAIIHFDHGVPMWEMRPELTKELFESHARLLEMDNQIVGGE